jgi:peptidoglycan/LPS O-acetylase OafA/YrhL
VASAQTQDRSSARVGIGSLRYRPEIDGLRGVAVLAVLLYHAHVPACGGGYLGVDVFFVISGYLITQLLERSSGSRDPRLLGEFLLRRARRVLPALYVLLPATAIGAIVIFLPADLIRFGRSLLLAPLFLGNVGAWLDGGYFDPGWRFTPLRHLWSIGVEEQFYLIFPIFLFGIAQLTPKWRPGVVAGLIVLSLLLSIWAAGRWPLQNYYLLPTRGWELLTGVFLAITPQLASGGRRTAQIMSMLALALLTLLMWQARFEHFPSLATAAACASTAILIATNTQAVTVAGRILSLRPVLFTGLISYSLYLWHAPILAYFSYYNVQDFGVGARVSMLTLIYVVAALSWRYVECPLRRQSLARTARLLLSVGIPSTAVLALCGFWLMRSDGMPQRFAITVLQNSTEETTLSPETRRCLSLPSEEISAGKLCAFGPEDATAPKVVVWGDSHAQALLGTYRYFADAYHLRIYFAVKGACWPLLGAEAGAAGYYWHDRCVIFNRAVARAIAVLRPQRVILNSYWLDTSHSAGPEFVRNLLHPASIVVSGIERTLSAVNSAGASACAVLTVPGYPYPIPYALTMAKRRHLDVSLLGLPRGDAFAQYQTVEDELRSFARIQRLAVVDLKDALCRGARCLVSTEAGGALYQDANHLSPAAGPLVNPVVEPCIADLKQ